MSTVNPELVVTEQKLKNASARFRAAIKEDGVALNWGANKFLNEFAKAFFGRPYEEAKATFFAEGQALHEAPKSVYLVRAGSNVILVENGAYVTATNPGTDMEMSEAHIQHMAASAASRVGVEVKNYTLPEAIAELPLDSDGEYVEFMERMGFFSAEGSIFEAIEKADLITVNGMSIWHADFMDPDKLLDEGDIEGGIAWDITCLQDVDCFEFELTFGAMCKARRFKEGWIVQSLQESVVIQTFSLD